MATAAVGIAALRGRRMVRLQKVVLVQAPPLNIRNRFKSLSTGKISGCCKMLALMH